MTTCFGKSCTFGLLCVSFVNVYQSVYVRLSLLVLRVGFDCIILDQCIFIYFATLPKLYVH